MVTSAVLSSGRERHYEYEGTFMTNVSNEKGHNLVHNWYERGYLKGQEFEQGAVYSYKYEWSSTAYYPAKVWVTLPDFTIKELSVADSVPEYVKNYHR
jgi:hypothetical protein